MILSMTYCAIPSSPLSVRSTNVYEEKSLGVFHDDDESEELSEDLVDCLSNTHLSTHFKLEAEFSLVY